MSLSTTTSLAVLSTDTVAQDDLLLVDKGLGIEAQRTAGVVSTVSTVNTHDIFADGSAVATYQLDGDATDLGGNYDGTATDVTYDTGKFGQAGVFNGSSSYIASSNFIDGNTPFTFSFWVKTLATTGTFVSSGYTSNNERLVIGSSTVNTYNGTWHYITTNHNDGNWHNIVASFDGSTFMKVYKDGSLVGDIVFYSLSNNSINLTLGARNTGNIGGYSSGFIDQVRIFNRAITATEVSRLYAEEYKTVALSPALSAIPTMAETVSSYLPYTNDSYFNKPIDASSSDFTETSTTTTAVYAVGDIIKDTSTNKLYKCTVINTVGILLTDNGYFTGLSTLSVTSGVFTYTDGKNNYGYNRKSDTFTGSVDFSGATDGLKYVAKDLNANTFNFLDGKPNIGLYNKTSADDNRYVFDTESGKWYTTTGGELVTNGTFDTDTSGWSGLYYNGSIYILNSGSVVFDNGTAKIINGTDTTDYSGIEQALTLEIGDTYTISFTSVSSVNISAVISEASAIGTNSALGEMMNKSYLSQGSYVFEFTATATIGYLLIQLATNVDNAFSNIDNISVYKKQATLDALITTPMSFMKNPIMCQNGTPQYLVEQLANRRRRS